MRLLVCLALILLIAGSGGSASGQVPPPHQTLNVQATIPFEGESGTGEAYIYLSDLHDSLTNPVVISEGFDIDNGMGWEELYSFLNREEMIETMRAEGFDMVILNFTDATDHIQRNAFVLIELIEWVNATIPSGATVAVVGPSMGGLVAGYALAYMETHALEHNVRTFISFDAPHRGANIPLGIQYWLEFFSSLSEEAATMSAQLATPAARQMLVYHHTDPPETTGGSDSLRAVWLSDLADVGTYPQEPRNVAIANGSGWGADQGFAAGDQIIQYEYDIYLVVITGNVWAVPDGMTQMIFEGYRYIFPSPAESQTVSVGGTLPYDNAPGGSRPSMAQMDSTDVPGDILALHDSHCFIPTVSALDIETQDLFHDIAGDPDIMTRTPFDTIYYPSENQEHMDITAETAAWFMEEVRRGATSVEEDYPSLPAGIALRQNFPNPFNPLTTISYSVPRAGALRLLVSDAQGRRVRVLVDGHRIAGVHQIHWDGRNDAGAEVASGIYYYRLEAGGHAQTKKMIVLR